MLKTEQHILGKSLPNHYAIQLIFSRLYIEKQRENASKTAG